MGRSSTDAIPIFLDTWRNAKSASEYWYCLMEIFLEADWVKSHSAQLHAHFRRDYCKWEGTSALDTMIPEDKKKFDDLSNIVTIYRGIGLSECDRDAVAGLSWSVDKDTAFQFAVRAANCSEGGTDCVQDNAARGIGILIEAKIPKRHIFYYSQYGHEDEVVPDVRQLFDVKYVRWTSGLTNKNRRIDQSVEDDLEAKLRIWFPIFT